MKKRKFLLALFAGMLVLVSVNAAATIEIIDAPNAVGYSGLKFDDGNGNVIKLLDRNLGATNRYTACDVLINQDQNGMGWYYNPKPYGLLSCKKNGWELTGFNNMAECMDYYNQPYWSGAGYASLEACQNDTEKAESFQLFLVLY